MFESVSKELNLTCGFPNLDFEATEFSDPFKINRTFCPCRALNAVLNRRDELIAYKTFEGKLNVVDKIVTFFEISEETTERQSVCKYITLRLSSLPYSKLKKRVR